MLHWTSGTLVRIERTSAWKTWSIDYEPKLWSLKVRSSSLPFHPGQEVKWTIILSYCVSLMPILHGSQGWLLWLFKTISWKLHRADIDSWLDQLYKLFFHIKASLFYLNIIALIVWTWILHSLPGGFAQSELMSGHLIDFFVPFLPLEYRHVKLCARDAYAARGLETDEATLDEVAKAMLYVPKEERLFSAQGCKSIPQRINFFLP